MILEIKFWLIRRRWRKRWARKDRREDHGMSWIKSSMSRKMKPETPTVDLILEAHMYSLNDTTITSYTIDGEIETRTENPLTLWSKQKAFRHSKD